MWTDFANIILGAVLLLFGTDSLVNGISGVLARRVAETYPVALAGAITAALLPTISVTVAALITHQPDLALGGLAGAAIGQLGLVLGLAAVLAPLLARLRVLAWINPALLAAIVLVWILGFDQVFSAIDGMILVAAFVLVAMLIGRAALHERHAARTLFEQAPPTFGPMMLLLRILLGGVLIALGAWRLVVGGSGFAASTMLNPLIVGLLALGPASALAGAPSAILAARRGHGEFALAQALCGAMGSILLVLGGLAIWHPMAIAPSLWRFEIPALMALAVAIYPMMRSDGALSRREGALLLAAYAAFFATEIYLTCGL